MPLSRKDAARFEQFLDFAPDAIVGVDAAGSMVLANAQTEALFGYAREDLLGQPVEMLVAERFRGVPLAAQLELFGLRKDGSEFSSEISISTVETDDGTIAIVAIRDTTERRRLESDRERHALEQQLNLLRRSESVGQLAGGIAHDFNNILGVIINYSGFVADEIDAGSPAQSDLLEIRRAAERGAALTRQLLIFSRREVVRPQVIHLNELVAELDRLLRRSLGDHIELATQFEPELWATEADPGQIEQVLVNLAVNARDAMADGGRLLIETANVEVDEAYAVEEGIPVGSYVRIRVSDTGDGMGPEVAARAFEPFFTTKPRGQATGLGLSTVYGIVTDAGGDVKIYSEPGVGATVRVYLPATSRSAAVKPAAATPTPGRGERIVVAEDEDGVRMMVERILTQAGYDVVVAANGRAALDVLEQAERPADLLLTDVVMPEMLGPELAERARDGRPELAVLFMSGYIHQLLGSGALDSRQTDEVDFIEKPFTAEALLVRVRHALDKHVAT